MGYCVLPDLTVVVMLNILKTKKTLHEKNTKESADMDRYTENKLIDFKYHKSKIIFFAVILFFIIILDAFYVFSHVYFLPISRNCTKRGSNPA